MKYHSHTYAKLLCRSVRSTFARFLSILAIFAVGSGFLGGLIATTPDMQLTVWDYYRDTDMFDLYFKGTLGITEDDLESVRSLDYVQDATPAYVTDVTLDNSEGNYVTRIYGLDINDEDLVNGFVLKEGRLPQNKNECLICVPNSYSSSHHIGETYRISEENKDYGELSDTYNFEELTAVGMIDLPYYISIESETSSVGTGSVQLVMYVLPEAYSMDVWTDIYLTLKGASEIDCFSDEYTDYVRNFADRLESFGQERSEIRYNEIITDAQKELDDGWSEYNSSKTEAESELADVRAKLDDGWSQLADARAELDEAQTQLADAQEQINSAAAQLDSSIAAAQAQLDASLSAAAEEQKEAARSQVDVTFAPYQEALDARREQLEAQKSFMSETDYQAALSLLESSQAELDASKAAALNSAYEQIDAAIEQQRSASQAEIDAAKASGLAQIAQNQVQLDQKTREYNDGLQQADASEAELIESEADYKQAEQDSDSKLSDALDDLNAAQ